MKYNTNETKRMQQLAGVTTNTEISDNRLKKLLKVNSHESLYNSIIDISANDANSVALGMQLIYDNFDCAPNSAVISDVIDYLKQKAK
jgi:hypothetical protein